MTAMDFPHFRETQRQENVVKISEAVALQTCVRMNFKVNRQFKTFKAFKKLFVALVVVMVFYGVSVLALKAIGLDRVHLTIQQLGVWAPIAFILFCAMSVIIAPISSSSIFVTGGVLFGQQMGFLLSFLASTLGCCTNFWISRKLGRKVAARLVGDSSLNTLDRFTMRLNSHHSILFMMLVMPLSQDVVSYAVGLTKVQFWQFFVALMTSGAAIVAAYVYLGSGILEALV